MLDFDELTIRDQVADSSVIFQRGRTLYEDGAYMCMEALPEEGRYEYQVDGNYGDYSTVVVVGDNGLDCSCDCPYPGPGCKHVVAVALDVLDRVQDWQDKSSTQEPEKLSDYLTPEEIREKAMEDRRNRARKEEFKLIRGDM
ncbi:SWIM zinc finger family protein, partial [Desulfonatronospira sp. MSAO_Bac3]